LRRTIEPVEPATLARFATHWHGIVRRGRGLDALLDVIERLQGAPLEASLLESEILPARLDGFGSGDLDTLAAAGEIRWVGRQRLGARDGRISLYLADALPRLHRPVPSDGLTPLESRLIETLTRDGASFFVTLHQATGGGFARDVQQALWSLVWRGIVTNDGFQVLRTFTQRSGASMRHRDPSTRSFRSRRRAPLAAEGRWSLVHDADSTQLGVTEWAAATAQQLLHRHGLVSREVVAAEDVAGGFSALQTVLRSLEEAGRVRRGWFVAGLSASQFALPPVVDELRRLGGESEPPEVVLLAATDPANPWGATLPWPATSHQSPTRRPARMVDATVILVNGALAGWLGRGGRELWTWLPEDDAERAQQLRALATALASRARERTKAGLLLGSIDGNPAREHLLARDLLGEGFVAGLQGMHLGAGR
jgi:ATP-dependent Lhr-like helicase